jgi:hypothetical protein
MPDEVTTICCPTCKGFSEHSTNVLIATGLEKEVAPKFRNGVCEACNFSTRVYKLSNGSWTLNQVEALQDYLDAKKRRDEADATRNPGS